MQIHPKLAITFAMLFIASYVFSIPIVNAEETSGIPSSDEAPKFHAHVEFSPQGYVVKGTFTEFWPDTILVQPMYSLDGETYLFGKTEWDLQRLGSEDTNVLADLQNQTCFYASHEPFQSYLAGKLDSFYLKLRITRENGSTYDTQAAVIDRGVPVPVSPPNVLAIFASSMRIRGATPSESYGRYQLTVSADASPKDISAFLPDTLPIEIQITLPGASAYANVALGTIDCPVTWKPLSLPLLVAGESITISDAAEEIVIPGGTLVRTPMGVFQFGESFPVEQGKVELVLNAVAKDENPTGVLRAGNSGLEMAFDLKPTGAVSIRAFTFSNDGTEWTELHDVPLLDAINAQPLTANSGYTVILDNALEPYSSYLEAQSARNEPTPFYVGLKVEGGVYDGRQLVLAWPDTYELPPGLPDIAGAGGNEGNAGTDNSGDSTEEGQRPNLPQNPTDNPETITVQETASEQGAASADASESFGQETAHHQEDLLTPAVFSISSNALTVTLDIMEENAVEKQSTTITKTDMQTEFPISETFLAETEFSTALASSDLEEPYGIIINTKQKILIYTTIGGIGIAVTGKIITNHNIRQKGRRSSRAGS